MARILILYDTSYGHTKKIAEIISSEIKKKNHFVEAVDVSMFPHEVCPDIYDGVIVGAAVYAGSYSGSIVRWVKANAEFLNKMPSAFFSVCLGILQDDPKVQKDLRNVIANFFKKTGWHPGRWSIFAGALAYTKYNFVIKWFMRRIAKKAGGSTDTSSDHEYTDWEEVSKFASDFCQSVTGTQKEMPNWHI